jgi:hypothetical protein
VPLQRETKPELGATNGEGKVASGLRRS